MYGKEYEFKCEEDLNARVVVPVVLFGEDLGEKKQHQLIVELMKCLKIMQGVTK